MCKSGSAGDDPVVGIVHACVGPRAAFQSVVPTVSPQPVVSGPAHEQIGPRSVVWWFVGNHPATKIDPSRKQGRGPDPGKRNRVRDPRNQGLTY
jgi:hypothetical protein